MNLFNIIFLFLIGLQQAYCGDGLNWNRLPREINVLITNFIQPLFNDLPVIQFNDVIHNHNYDDLSIHFPSTASFEFIEIKKEHEKTLQEKGLIYQPDPKSVLKDSLVLPLVQLGLRDTSIWVNNYKLKVFLKNFIRCGNTINKMLFDIKDDKAVYYAKNDGGWILIGCPRDNTDHRPVCCFKNKKKILHSVCVHATDRNEFSIITSENGNNLIKINSFDNLKNGKTDEDIEPQRKFEIPISIKTIKKHEYIANNLFLLHCDEHLFFCTEKEDGTLNIALQSFFDSKAKQDTDRYSVISFCVNQDIRTPGGKARHFFLLSLKDGKYVILHVDLLNTYNTIRKICSLKKEIDAVFFDRIAFNKKGFCLWKDDTQWADDSKKHNPENTPAMSIGFEPDWINILENQTLFETFYKNDNQENKKNIVLYEGTLNKQNDKKENLSEVKIVYQSNDTSQILNQSDVKQTDTTPKKNIFSNKLKIVSFLLLSSLFIVFSLCKKLKPMRFFH